MRNPYEVLEIEEGSSMEEIKRAYRALAKQYETEQYGDNPLKDLGAGKMQELNEAYKYLRKTTIGSSSGELTSSNSASYATIRSNIKNGKLKEAEEGLNNIYEKDAEWDFLMGVLYTEKGWYDSAHTYLNNACTLEPFNKEYKETLNKLDSTNKSYRQTYYNKSDGDDGFCDNCLKFYCLEISCECCCEGGAGFCGEGCAGGC